MAGYAEFLASRGRSGEALSEIQRARDLEPLSLVVNTQVGWILFLGRRYDEAIDMLQKVIEMDSSFALAHGDLGLVYLVKGMYPEAILELRKSADLSGQLPIRVVWLAEAYALSLDKEQAQRLLSTLEGPAQRFEIGAEDMALVDIALGGHGSSSSPLEECFREPSPATDLRRAYLRPFTGSSICKILSPKP